MKYAFIHEHRNHFRITTLPEERQLGIVFERMEEVLETLAE